MTFIPQRSPIEKMRRKLKNLYIPMLQGNCLYPIAMRPMIEMLRKHNYDYKLVGAEIGVFRGWNAFNILHYLPIEKLYLIDPFMKYEGYKMQTKTEDSPQISIWGMAVGCTVAFCAMFL